MQGSGWLASLACRNFYCALAAERRRVRPRRMKSSAPLQQSSWILYSIQGIRSSVLAVRGREILQRLSKRGIRIPSTNRIMNAVRLTEDLNADKVTLTEADVDLQTRTLDAFRTLFEAFVVVWTAEERQRTVNPFPNDRLARLLEGADLIKEDRNPLARSIQFELYVGATLVLGGLDAFPNEPDYRTTYWGETIGVPAKRVVSASPNALRSNLRDAASQLRAAKLRGFVALSVDPHISDLSGATVDDVGAQFNAQVAVAHKQLADQSDQAALLGAFVFGHWSSFSFSGATPILHWREPLQILAFADSPNELKQIAMFQSGWRQRWENSFTEIGVLLRGESRANDAA